MVYIITVHYALRIEAESLDEAQRMAEKMTLRQVRDLVPDSFDIPDIHEDRSRWPK